VTPRVQEIARDLLFPESPVVLGDGTILVSELAGGRVTRILPDGSHELVAQTGGGPNGIAVLPDGRLIVCQNGGASWGTAPWPHELPGCVQLFLPVGPPDEPVDPQLQLVETTGRVSSLTATFRALDGRVLPLARPSDICLDDDGGYWVTDGSPAHGRTRTLTGVLYGTVDGDLREVIFPLEMPNGIALSPDGARLYVTETRTRRVWSFDVGGPGRIDGGRGFATVPSGGPLNFGGADGVCVDDAGHVIVSTIGAGGITVFAADGTLVAAIPMDDPMTSNVAFDRAGRRLVVTLASTGRVVSIDWPDALEATS
jgi:gluconolactonase